MSQSLHNHPIVFQLSAEHNTFKQPGVVLLRRRRSILFAITFSPPAFS
ncbi:hypothetical protein [Pseudomonas fluorescens]|nr:hypothetical protein [Pseudomonas fluorescens]